MSLTSEDMKRVTDLAQFSKEFFTVEFRASTNTLSLIVDGSKRNTIELDNAEEEYEKLLEIKSDLQKELVELGLKAFSIIKNVKAAM